MERPTEPGLWRAHLELARAYLEKGLFAEALEAAETAATVRQELAGSEELYEVMTEARSKLPRRA
jgi:hypothetical protein